jgi:transposase
MKITGTKEAFLVMLEVKGISKELGVSKATVSNWKRYIKEGKVVSLDKMEEMLQKYGAKVEVEKVWEINLNKNI